MKMILLLAIMISLHYAGDNEIILTDEEMASFTGEEYVKEHVEKTSKLLPIEIDKITKTVSIIGLKKTIIYIDEIETTINENDDKDTKTAKFIFKNEETKKRMIKILYEHQRIITCKDKNIGRVIKEKDIMFHISIYEKESKKEIGSYTISKEDCKKIEG